MQSRFGLKDALLLLLILAVGAAVILSMIQEERRWTEIRALRESVDAQTKLLADIERALRDRAPAGHSAHPPAGPDAWARPGVPISRPAPWTVPADPRTHPDFSPGGTLTELCEGLPQRLTPYLANDPIAYRIVNESVCEPLAALDPRTLELKGLLAEAWQLDPAGLWLRVKIRDHARFSDGGPVTAEDIRFTFMDYVLKQDINAASFRSEMGQVARVDVLSARVAEFHFKEPRFSNLRAALRNAILPAHYYARFPHDALNASTALVLGSGPYRFESTASDAQWKPPAEITLVRNERYWGDPPPIDRLCFVFIPDNAARFAAFESAAGDLMRSTPEQHAAKSTDPLFTQRASALAWLNMRSGYTLLAWNCGERHGKPTPFADPRVRRALTLALDRDRINRDFYESLCKVATGPFPEWQADPAITPLPFDLEEARTLLAQAGWSDRNVDGVIENHAGEPFNWELTYARGSVVGERVGPYIADQCARLGIRMTTRVLDAAALAAARSAHDFDALPVQWSWSDTEYDPFQTLHSSQIDAGDNWIQWRHEAADRLMEEARRTIEPAERAELWRRLHRIIDQEQPSTYLLNVPWTRFVSTRLRNVHAYPTGLEKREMFIPKENQ
jgi:peptide/nickel transport system substrate-binding protein